MNINKYLIIAAAGALLASCSDDQFAGQGDNRSDLVEAYALGHGVERGTGMAGRVTRPVSPDGRTLGFAWESGDQVLVYDPELNLANGILTVSEEAVGHDTGEFTGRLFRNGKTAFTANVYHVGNGAGEIDDEVQHLALNISEQTGRVADLGKYDVMADLNCSATSTTTNKLKLSFNVASTMSFVRFEPVFPEGVSYSGEAITVSGESLASSCVLTLAGGSMGQFENGDITLTAPEKLPNGNPDLYMTFFPGQTGQLTFSVRIGKKNYQGTFHTISVDGNTFYTAEGGAGAQVPMEYVKVDYNPADVESWPTTDVKEDGVCVINGISLMPTSQTAWCINERTAGTDFGGFCTYLTYKNNAITGCNLRSAMSDSDNRVFMYQWGRWLGFPTVVEYGWMTYNGMHEYDQGDQWSYLANDKLLGLPGINYNNLNLMASLKYITDNTHAAYQVTADVDNGYVWSQTVIDRSDVCFAAVNNKNGLKIYDYAANTDCTWESRTGNPCPDGWRVPTLDELATILYPGTDIYSEAVTLTLNQTKAMFKTVKGKKFAMRWTLKTHSSGYKIVEIQSVPVGKDVTDPSAESLYEDVKVLKVFPYGYLSARAAHEGYGEYAMFWTNTNEYDSNYGWMSVAVTFNFSGNTVTIGAAANDRCCGMNVMPLRDDDAVATPRTPWLPYGQIH